MKKYSHVRLIWFSSSISILMLAGSAFGNNGSAASKSTAAKRQDSNAVSNIERLPDYQYQGSRIISNGSTTLTDVVNDGGFEMGAGSGAWNEFSLNFGTPLCDANCGTGGGTGPHTGNWWCWFGGTSAAEMGSVDQSVIIPAGSANLSFYLEIPVGEIPGFMKVVIDSDTLLTVTEADTHTYATYSQVSLDVSAYADGGTHNLKFFSMTTASAGPVTNFFIDDISLEVVTGLGDPLTNTPGEFALKQNYPNPFNPLTTIAYQLPASSNVVLKIYSLSGQQVKALVNGRQSAGLQQVVWDGRDDNGYQVASGIYLYRLRAGDLIQTKKMTLLR